jgi:hypothetical protein
MALVSNPKDGDEVSVRQAIARLGSSKLGSGASPTFGSLTLTGLTTNSLIYTPSSKLLTSLGAATNGQIPIGSTGAVPTLAGLTGTANQITVTNGAGSITLATPQDIHTGASPTFDGGTFTSVVTGILPTAGTHLATKEYVDLAIGASFDYFLSNTASGVGSNYLMYPAETGEAESTVDSSALSQGDDQLAFAWLTEAGEPGTVVVRDGLYDCHIHLNRAVGNKSVDIYWTLSYVDADGSSNETLLLTSETITGITTSEVGYDIHGTLGAETPTGATKRLLFKVFANVGATGTNAVVTATLEGTHDAHISIQLPSSVWQNQGDVLDDLNTLGANSADSEFLVGTGAGALAWENAATAATSMGLGTGDSPTFAGLNIATVASLPGTVVVNKIIILDTDDNLYLGRYT